MKKTIIFTFLITVLYACYPVKQIVSKNYKLNDDLSFTLIKYSEPPTQPYFIRSENEKYVTIKIEMKNLTSYDREVNFWNFEIGSDEGIFDRYPLWKIVSGIQLAGTVTKSTKFLPNESKKIWLNFIVPKEKNIKYIIFNGNKEEISFGKTKQSIL
ncbi:hypothetical protein [uncultured Tenacibaculum sp.]|uniref:hypothetical protein n=1 Tax=uncultured Tenacibaculum sp. TaxID=174713 RepID=UPI002630401B|nr:hypothetical protein [uncultured Tenacibaculum sp.]